MLNELVKEVYQRNIIKGYHIKPISNCELLCLIHSEVSEAVEADRKGRRMPNVSLDQILKVEDNDEFIFYYESAVKGTYEEELADILIRLLGLCGKCEVDLQSHLELKMRYNLVKQLDQNKKY